MTTRGLKLLGPESGPVLTEWPQQEGLPRILIITGYPGSGKTTLANRLAARYTVQWISRYTTRPPRPDEKPDMEYKFVSPPELEYLRLTKQILTWKIAQGESENPDGSKYERGTPAIKCWPKGGPGIDLVLGILSPRLYRRIRESARAPQNMRAIFLAGRNEDLLSRIVERRGGDWVSGHVTKLKKYRKLRLEDWYDKNEVVVDTTALEPQEIVFQAIHRLNLPQPHVIHP